MLCQLVEKNIDSINGEKCENIFLTLMISNSRSNEVP